MSMPNRVIPQPVPAYAVSVFDFGAVGDSVADDTAAFQAALDSGASIIQVPDPPGPVYRLTRMLKVRRTVKVIGSGGQDHGRCILQWLWDAANPDPGGILIQSPYAVPGQDGSRSVLEGLNIQLIYQSTSGPNPRHGVVMNAPAVLRDCWINKWTGDGIHINGSAWDRSGDPNLWELTGCFCSENKGDGLHVVGSDANAGQANRLSVTANGGWGVYDISDLGNCYITPHARSNARGGYYVGRADGGGSVNYTTILAPYAEADQPMNYFDRNVYIFGQQLANGSSGGNRFLPGDSQVELVASDNWITPLRISARYGSTPNPDGSPSPAVAPNLTLCDENGGPGVYLSYRGAAFGYYPGQRNVGVAKCQLVDVPGVPLVEYGMKDFPTQNIGSVAQTRCISHGPAYGDGEAVWSTSYVDNPNVLQRDVFGIQRDHLRVYAGLELPCITNASRAIGQTANGLPITPPRAGYALPFLNTDANATQWWDGAAWH